MELIELIGRLVFVGMFVLSGITHFAKREAYVAYTRSMGGPAPEVMVPATGVMLFAGGVMIALGVWADLGALLLVAFLIPTAYFMHAFWETRRSAGAAGPARPLHEEPLARGGVARAVRVLCDVQRQGLAADGLALLGRLALAGKCALESLARLRAEYEQTAVEEERGDPVDPERRCLLRRDRDALRVVVACEHALDVVVGERDFAGERA